MNYQEFSLLFAEYSQKNGIAPLAEDQIKSFYVFTNHLIEVNQTTNLTAIRDIPSIITKHFIDSLLVSELIPQGASVLDIGCGPGFPTIPLAIARPDIQITALDSTQKKIAFVESSAKKAGMSNVFTVSGRAEDRELMKKLGKFDIVVSRAVAKLNILCELALPYAKIGGNMIAMKAAKGQEELKEAQNAIQTLGGGPVRLYNKELLVSDSDKEERSLIVIQKEKATPSIYPRAFSAIKKNEL